MHLTAAQKEQGRKNFLEAVSGTPSFTALAGAGPAGPSKGGPVKAALIGAGVEGKVLLSVFQKGWADLRAICDINPDHSREAADGMVKNGWTRPREYQEYKQMLEKEDLEAVLVATPLKSHAEVVVDCLKAGKHVLCEKMMAWDVEGCRKMMDAARTSKRLLEIGYQRFYSAGYQGAYEAIIKPGLLGEIYYARAAWHRNKSWRRTEKPPSPDFDPRKWGYDNWDHLVNWRLYRKYSRGLLAELGSHQISIVNWFYGAVPEAVYASGGVHRFKEGEREAFDHVYATFDYPGGRTATFSSIESNAFDNTYELFEGTKGTLMLSGNGDGYLFTEKEAKAAARTAEGSGSAPAGAGPAAKAAPPAADGEGESAKKTSIPRLPYRNEVAGFCAAVRSGAPLRVGPEKALGSASACITAEEAGHERSRLLVASTH
jgi:predicted dehydrogenase